MQESRLFKIIYHLMDKGQTTASELAQKFEVSVRTIYRDIDFLSEAGIPIYTETGRNGGICLMDDFVLDKALLSEEEKQKILTALQSINMADNNDILEKLSALFKIRSENWLEVDLSRWGNEQQDNEKFNILKTAIIHRNCLKIKYAGSNDTITERTIHPLKLTYKSKSWYLKTFCTDRQDYRTFKLSRIIDFEILNETFSPHTFHEEKKLPQIQYNNIILRFPEEMAYRIYDEFNATQVKQQENGDFIVSAKMPEDAWLTGFLLSFGTQVDIIEPEYLKELVANQAKLIYEKNHVNSIHSP